MWSYWICDTRTGVKQLQVYPSSGPFNRALNAPGSGGSHSFQLGDTTLTRAQWKALTTPWARTLAVCWDDQPHYAGVITKRPYNRDTKTLTLQHVDIRGLLAKRYPFGVTSYWTDGTETTPNKLVCTNKHLYSIASMVVSAGLIGPTSIYSLPIVVPSVVTGSHSRTYFNYNFTTVVDALQELQDADGGPDIDFEPRWSAGGTLEWLMRTGTNTTPALGGSTFDWNMTVEKPGLFDVSLDEDAQHQATGVFSIGSGSEEDMVVAGRGLTGADVGSVPALDTTQSYKSVDNLPTLIGHSDSELAIMRNTTKQWDLSFLATDTPGLNALRLGSTLRLFHHGDPWIDDGWTSLRLIGYSGQVGSDKITLDVQPVGGA